MKGKQQVDRFRCHLLGWYPGERHADPVKTPSKTPEVPREVLGTRQYRTVAGRLEYGTAGSQHQARTLRYTLLGAAMIEMTQQE